MKNKSIFKISLIIMIIFFAILIISLGINSEADWIIRISGTICILDMAVLIYSRNKGI